MITRRAAHVPALTLGIEIDENRRVHEFALGRARAATAGRAGGGVDNDEEAQHRSGT